MKSGRNKVFFSGGAIAIAAISGLNEVVALALARLTSRLRWRGNRSSHEV